MLWTPFALFASARLLNVGSTPSKTNSAYLPMLERYLSLAPAGMMWSVVILSPVFRVTSPRIVSGRGTLSGGFPMFGPRRTVTFEGSSAGGRLPGPDAEAAGRLEDPRPGAHQRRDAALLRRHLEDLARAGGDAEGDVFPDHLAVQDLRERRDVLVGGVRARPDEDLVDPLPRDVLHAGDVVGAGRLGAHRRGQ